jgi:hypothetical protein
MKSKPSKINKDIVYVNKLTCKVVDDKYNKTVIFDTYAHDNNGEKFKICKRYTFDRFGYTITNEAANDRNLILGIRKRLNDTFKDFNFSTTDIILNK